ncbi:MAG: gliding motility-associated protein GldE [Ginsengibacter sp.]
MDYHSIIELFLPATFMVIVPIATPILIFVLIILFLLSFLISGSEVAFFSLTLKDVNMLKTRRQPSYVRIVDLLDQPKTLLASLLIANCLVNIGIIFISNNLLSDLVTGMELHVIPSFILKVVIITTVIVLFGEILPKVWAANHKIWFASTGSMVVELFQSLLFKVSRKLVNMSDGIESSLNSDAHSMDDNQLDYAIDLLPDHEASIDEKQILKGIRKFGNTTAKQTMRTRLDVSGIEINTPYAEMMVKVKEMHYSRVPVYVNNLDEIAGMLHTKDLLPHLNEQEGFDWHPLMRPVFYVHEQKLIKDLLQDFRNKRMHIAVVVDEFGGTSGIVTLEDIMEEVIGDIQDEFDDEQSANKKLDDHNYIFEGRTMINDLCRTLRLPANTFEKLRGESDSLGGLLLEIAGEIPKVNEPLETEKFIFTPLEINKNRIEKVKITLRNNEEL